jgi:steroid 5-alpha reductase family enzyme
MSFLEIYLVMGFALWCFSVGLWLASLIRRDASMIDPFWGLLSLTACLIARFFSEEGAAPRQTLLLILVALWSLRLSLYLLWRNWGEAEDFRYRAWREQYGDSWWWRSYLQVFLLQGLIAWLLSIVFLAAHYSSTPSRLGWLDFLGVGLWALGFFFETVGDFQLARFRSDTSKRGQVLQTGVWRYTRHPNYFGDAMQWWGFYLIALAAGGWWTFYAPALMTFLLVRVSGVAMLERTLSKDKPAYADYIRRTNAFLPWFPKK